MLGYTDKHFHPRPEIVVIIVVSMFTAIVTIILSVG